MTLEIRDAAAGDRAAWEPLWQGYLRFYEVSLAPEVTDTVWQRLMDPAEPLTGRFAFVDGRMAGFTHSHLHGTTWAIAPACYLEDLFVDETIRGHGTGRALVDDLIASARRNGWARVYWHTNEANARARALYDSYVKADPMVRYMVRLV